MGEQLPQPGIPAGEGGLRQRLAGDGFGDCRRLPAVEPGVFQDVEQALELEGLGHVVVGTGTQGEHGGLGAVEPREHDDGKRGREIADVPQRLKAVHSGKPLVQQHGLDTGGENFQSLRSGFRRNGPPTLVLRRDGQQALDVLIVINDKQVRSNGGFQRHQPGFFLFVSFRRGRSHGKPKLHEFGSVSDLRTHFSKECAV